MAAAVIETFLIKFFQIYDAFLDHDFYIFGESYGGHYVPAVTARLVKNSENPEISEKDLETRNRIQKALKGMGIGDSYTSAVEQADCYPAFFTSAGLISQWRQQKFKSLSGRLIENTLSGDYREATYYFYLFDGADHPDATREVTSTNLYNSRRNNYGSAVYTKWIRTKEFYEKFSIPDGVTFYSNSDYINKIYLSFDKDIPVSFSSNITDVIKSGKKVFMYHGQNDNDIPFTGVEKLLSAADWIGFQQWRQNPRKIWYSSEGQNYGWKKCYQNFYFAMVNNAGHLVPRDQGRISLILLKEFIENRMKC